MKNTFKKVVGLLLALLMIVSVCTVAFATETENEPETEVVPTIQDFGIFDGTGVEKDTVVKFQDEYVIQMHRGYSSQSGNYNLRLADPANPEAPYTVEEGKTYTVLFDYYLNVPVAFQVRPMKHPTTSGQRGNPYSDMVNIYSNKFAGDGKWHTGSVSFTYKNVTGGGETLHNIGLLHQCSVDAENPGYIKNIRIVEESGPVNYSNGSLSIKNIMATNSTLKYSGGATSNFDVVGKATLNADNTVTIIPNKNQSGANAGTAAKPIACFAPLTEDGKYYQIQAGYTYKVTVKYKVDKSSKSTSVGVGISYGKTGAGYQPTTPMGCETYNGGNVTEGWETLVATISTDKDSNLKITVSGEGAPTDDSYTKITFGDIVVAKIINGNSSNVVFTEYNDNGLATVYAGYKGVDIAPHIVGANADNLALGEKFLGWYEEGDFTTAATKVVDGTVYAKYPTIFIDNFTALNGYEKNNQMSNGGVEVIDGFVKLNGNTGTGFVVPAYDDEAVTPAKFIPGKQYYVSIYYKRVDGNGNDGVRINMITGDRYGSTGSRTGNNLFNQYVTNDSTWGVVSQYFTQAELAKKDGTEGFVENMIFRTDTQDKIAVEVVIARIAFTDPALVEEQTSEEMLLTGSIRKEKTAEDGAYTSAGIRFKARVSAATRDAASEIGFVAVPTAYLNGASVADYVATEGNKAVFAKVKTADKEIVYDVANDFYNRAYTDYQMVLTGLTKADTEVNLLATKMTVALYVVVDGVTTYTNALSYSYEDIAKYY